MSGLQARSEEGSYRIVITSIGNATPSSAAAVARGLGIRAAEVIRCLYRAPAVLVDSVEFSIATQLHKLLEGIGYEVELQPCTSPRPETSRLFEISVYLKDASLYQAAAARLGEFMGMDTEEAGKLLLNPPCTVLGGVSEPTVLAFEEHMKNLVEITVSHQESALFSVFMGEASPMVQRRIREDLRQAGFEFELAGDSGQLIGVDVVHGQVNKLWDRHKGNPALKIVNQDFLRYDLHLCDGGLGPHKPVTASQQAYLTAEADIPADMVEDVVAASPVAIFEAVTREDMFSIMKGFHEQGITLRADLITFQYLQLKILASPEKRTLNNDLALLGLSACEGALPALLPDAMPEVQARVIKHRLEQNGHEVQLMCV